MCILTIFFPLQRHTHTHTHMSISFPFLVVRLRLWFGFFIWYGTVCLMFTQHVHHRFENVAKVVKRNCAPIQMYLPIRLFSAKCRAKKKKKNEESHSIWMPHTDWNINNKTIPKCIWVRYDEKAFMRAMHICLVARFEITSWRALLIVIGFLCALKFY